MDGDTKVFLWTAIVLVMIAVLIVQIWPRRRFRAFTADRRIAAPVERVWELIQVDLENPRNAAFNDTISDFAVLGTDPEITEIVVDSSGRHGTHHNVIRSETLDVDPPNYYASRIIAIDGKPHPFGPDQVWSMRLTHEDGATDVTLTWQGETSMLIQQLLVERRLRKYMDSLKSFCEIGEGTAVPKSERSPMVSLGLTALTFASFAYLLGWEVALILSLAIIIHEFGHWLAMRMTGQPNPRIMLIPFFGGVAIPNHPYKTQFDCAFVSLAGAGFSVLPCLFFLLSAFAVGIADGPVAGNKLQVLFSTGRGLLVIAVLFGALNALQLLPLLPLDGGHVLRRVIESTNARRARPILLGLAVAGMAGFGVMGSYILAAILALGALQAWHIGTDHQVARPMGGPGIAAIGLGYILILAIHVSVAVYGARVLGIDFQ